MTPEAEKEKDCSNLCFYRLLVTSSLHKVSLGRKLYSK